MSDTRLLIRAYYEALHERLAAARDRLVAGTAELLNQEVAKRGFDGFDADKSAAYQDACIAFIDERIEMYNPIGVQYTFDRINAETARELELQLNWYDSTAEWEALVDAAKTIAIQGVTQQCLPLFTEQLIEQCGAYPDNSIIEAYEVAPTLQKLPDYLVACAIEQILHRRPDTEAPDSQS